MHIAYFLDGRLDPPELASAETYSLVLKNSLHSKKKKRILFCICAENLRGAEGICWLKTVKVFVLHSTNGDPHMIAVNTWIEYLRHYFVWIAWSLVATDVIWTSCLWVCWTLPWFMGSELILAVNLNTTILWDVTCVVWYNFPVKLRGVTSHGSVKFIVIQFHGHLIRRFSLGLYIIWTETGRWKWPREINTCR
jgi:hypothetical protein